MPENDSGQLSFIAMLDNGGRRLRIDRRKRSEPISFPDRRSGRDRRSGLDRRGLSGSMVKVKHERRRKFVQPPFEV